MENFAADEEIHYRLIKRIEADPEASQRKLAVELGVSLGKVNYSLKALVSVGWVKVENFVRSNNKLGYVLTPVGIKEKARITALFLKKKQAQYEQLRVEIASLELELAQSESDKQS